MEVRTPLTVEDFDAGDRVYWFKDYVYRFGHVSLTRHNEHIERLVRVTLDSGEEVVITGAKLKKREFGKILPLRRVEKGSVVSKWGNFTKQRHYYTVEEFVPGEFITLKPFDTSQPTKTVEAYSSRMDLEKEFLDWELEG